MLNAPPLWVPLSPRVIASLWRTWYVAMVKPALSARRSWPVTGSCPGFIRLGGPGIGVRRHRWQEARADILCAEAQRPRARAWASAMLYRSYLRTASDIFIRRRYRHERLNVPTLLVFGAEDFYVPRSYLSGWQSHAPDMRVEFVPRCGHFLPRNAPNWRRPTFANFLR